MAARKFNPATDPTPVRSRWHIRLVQDGDETVSSPALALQQAVDRGFGTGTAIGELEHYERFPLAVRLAIPLVGSALLWGLIIAIF